MPPNTNLHRTTSSRCVIGPAIPITKKICDCKNGNAKALEVANRIVERMNFEFAAVARSRIDLVSGDRPPE